MKRGQNNRGFKDANAPRWGVRRDMAQRYPFSVGWHAQDAQLNDVLVVAHMTLAEALCMKDILASGKLSLDGNHS